MNSTKKTARIAGLLYLLLAITGAYSLMFVSSRIYVRGDNAATISNILSKEYLLRTGIVSNLISNVIFIFLVYTLYNLLKQVNEYRAKLMVVLVLVQIPIGFILSACNITSLMILKGGIVNVTEPEQLQNFAMLFIKLRSYGIIILEIFWGLWLIPFGQLVYKSGFIPRILGVLLIINGIAYIIDSLSFMLLPGYRSAISQVTIVFESAGEPLMILWLLIIGVKSSKSGA